MTILEANNFFKMPPFQITTSTKVWALIVITYPAVFIGFKISSFSSFPASVNPEISHTRRRQKGENYRTIVDAKIKLSENRVLVD